MQVEYITKNINETQVIKTIVEKYNSGRDIGHEAHVEIINLKGKIGLIEVSIPEKGLEGAKILLELDSNILNSCNSEKKEYLIVTKNEASQFLNEQLYPLINQYERNIRRIVYVAAAFSDEKGIDVKIQKLEEKTWRQIYSLLFCDENLKKNLKTILDEGPIDKRKLIDFINDFEEETLWNKIIRNPDLDIVANTFPIAKDYRNDVMHAHHISFEEYEEAKELFETINTKLDIATAGVLPIDFEKLGDELLSFVAAVDSLLDYAETADNVSRALQVLAEYLKTHGIDNTNGE